jgi:hypothetical protein
MMENTLGARSVLSLSIFPFLKKNCSNYQILFLYALKNMYLEFGKFLS